MSDIHQLTIAVLGYLGADTARACLSSIRANTHVPYTLVYLDNGSGPSQNWVWELYKDGLCDVLISKRDGGGGGVGQTDLFRWVTTPYTLFVQQDQLMVQPLGRSTLDQFIHLLENGYQCIDLNGDQSGRGIWTDRAHLINTSLFNSLAPFPNGGPGADDKPWNEAHLQQQFSARSYQIAHVRPVMFADCGKWSFRQAGDGIFKHRCDTKQIWVLKRPTHRTDVYPPFNDEEWSRVLDGSWVDGSIPDKWVQHSFVHWPIE